MKSPWNSALVKRIVAIAEAPAPMAMPAAMYAGPARQSAVSAATSSGSVSATSTTCSPKTIVEAEVESESGFRISPSRPHIAAARLTRTTPGSLSRPRSIAMSLAACFFVPEQVVEALATADQAGGAVRHEHRGGPGHGVVVGAHSEGVRAGAGYR